MCDNDRWREPSNINESMGKEVTSLLQLNGVNYDVQTNKWKSEMEIQNLKPKLKVSVKSNPSSQLQIRDYLKKLIGEKDENFLALLSPMETKENNGASSGSLFQVLIDVPSIQVEIAELVLNQMVKLLKKSPSKFESLPLQIITQFRWLSYLNDGNRLLSLIFDVFDVLSIQQQQDVLMMFCDIFDQRFHDDFANKILDLIDKNRELEEVFLATAIKTIELLKLSSDMFQQVRSKFVKLSNKTPNLMSLCLGVIIDSTIGTTDADLCKILDFITQKFSFWISSKNESVDIKWMSNIIAIIRRSVVCDKLLKYWKIQITSEDEYEVSEIDYILLFVMCVGDSLNKSSKLLPLFDSKSDSMVENVFKLLSEFFNCEHQTISQLMLVWCFNKDNTINEGGLIACSSFYRNLSTESKQYFIGQMIVRGLTSKDTPALHHMKALRKIYGSCEPIALEGSVIELVKSVIFDPYDFKAITFAEILRFFCYYQLSTATSNNSDEMSFDLEELFAFLIEKQLCSRGVVYVYASSGCVALVETLFDFIIYSNMNNYNKQLLNNCINMYFEFSREEKREDLINLMSCMTKKIHSTDASPSTDLLNDSCSNISDRLSAIVKPYLTTMENRTENKKAVTLSSQCEENLVWDIVQMTSDHLTEKKIDHLDSLFVILPQTLAFLVHCSKYMNNSSEFPLMKLINAPILLPDIELLRSDKMDEKEIFINLISCLIGISWLIELINIRNNNEKTIDTTNISLFFSYHQCVSELLMSTLSIPFITTKDHFEIINDQEEISQAGGVKRGPSISKNPRKKIPKYTYTSPQSDVSGIISRLAELTRKFCFTFPNTPSLVVISQYLNQLDEEALKNESMLETIRYIMRYCKDCLSCKIAPIQCENDYFFSSLFLIYYKLNKSVDNNNINNVSDINENQNLRSMFPYILEMAAWMISCNKLVRYSSKTLPLDISYICQSIEEQIKRQDQLEKIMGYLDIMNVLNTENLSTSTTLENTLKDKLGQRLTFTSYAAASKKSCLKKYLLKTLEYDYINEAAFLTHLSKTLVEWSHADQSVACETIPILEKNYFPTFFAVAMQTCAKQLDQFASNLLSRSKKLSLKVMSTPVTTTNETPMDVNHNVLCIEKYIEITSMLVDIVKVNSDKEILRCCVKSCTSIVNTFNKKVVSFFNSDFLNYKDLFLACIRKLQHFTRMLHHICHYAKSTKDVSLAAFVPLLKKSLEQLVFGVKTMLERNHCGEAFWMGNLKNKDLQGREIVSQYTQVTQAAISFNDDDSTSDSSDAGSKSSEKENNGFEKQQEPDVTIKSIDNNQHQDSIENDSDVEI